MTRVAITALLLFAVAGCTPNFAKVMNSLAKDPAIVSGSVQTVYGTGRFTRIGATTNAVTVSPDGTVTVNK